MFDAIQAAPPDAILGLTEAFKNDPNTSKVNLTVGVYKDEAGLTPVLESVKAAEAKLLAAGSSKGYLPIGGLDEFCKLTQNLYFGDGHEVNASNRAATFQTPGGTGALRVAADFVHQNLPSASIW